MIPCRLVPIIVGPAVAGFDTPQVSYEARPECQVLRSRVSGLEKMVVKLQDAIMQENSISLVWRDLDELDLTKLNLKYKTSMDTIAKLTAEVERWKTAYRDLQGVVEVLRSR